MDVLSSRFPRLCRLSRQSFASMTRRELDWVWQDWIPRGFLSLIVGELGVGKTAVALELAAMVSRGWKTLPSAEMRQMKAATESVVEGSVVAEVGENGGVRTGTGGAVVMFGYESESIVLDRLEAMGADLENVHWLGRW